jgi:nitrile hydratase accessory protein
LNRPDETRVAPLQRMDGEPVFDEPWQASVLAMADTLIARGVITARDWSAALGAALKEAEASGAADNSDTYYRSALKALERVVAARGGISASAVSAKRDAWEAAYLSTPHGQPVTLKDG